MLVLTMVLFTGLFANQLNAQCSSSKSAHHKMTSVIVGGTEMNSNKDIISNMVKSNAHNTLVTAVKAASLVKALQGDGPFTVFAPVDDAFENLPEGTLTTLLQPQNKSTLSKILTYHVVAGKLDAKAIIQAIKHGNGSATVETLSGNKLTAMMNGNQNVVLKDENGRYANVSVYDAYQSNGVVHVIDAVVLPK